MKPSPKKNVDSSKAEPTKANCREGVRRGTRKRPRGFTLLEVLIALAVLAISSLAVIRQIANSAENQQRLEQKTIALLLAENQLNALQVSKDWPGTGRRSEEVELMDREWIINTEISETSDPWLRRIEVEVVVEAYGEEATLMRLTGFRGRY